MELYCNYCHAKFESYLPNQLYCSQTCRKRQYKLRKSALSIVTANTNTVFDLADGSMLIQYVCFIINIFNILYIGPI